MKSKFKMAKNTLYLPAPWLPKWLYRLMGSSWLPLDGEPAEGEICIWYNRWYVLGIRPKSSRAAR